MPPRGLTNPAPKTESAREARKSFFCDLCSKGYSRMNEFEAHESSYDHQHKKRLKEMKQMSRDPLASTKARKAERKADEKSGLITIKPVKIEVGGGKAAQAPTGFKRGGFKNAFGSAAEEAAGNGDAPIDDHTIDQTAVKDMKHLKPIIPGTVVESDTDDEGYKVYDPRKPTGCYEGCPGRSR